jgi:hypothetical protein
MSGNQGTVVTIRHDPWVRSSMGSATGGFAGWNGSEAARVGWERGEGAGLA